MIVIELIMIFILASFVEWFVHRYIMHLSKFARWFPGIYQDHAITHHGYCYGENIRKAKDNECRLVSIAFTFASSFLITLVVAGMFLLISWEMSLLIILFVIIHHIIWNIYHLELHDPKNRWFARWWLTRWHFLIVSRHHTLHHWYDRGKTGGCNYTAMTLGVADILLGTYKTANQTDRDNLKKIGL